MTRTMGRRLIPLGAIGALVAGCSQSERQLETDRRYSSSSYSDTTYETFGRTNRTVTGLLVQRSGDSIRFRIRTRADEAVAGVDFTLHPASRRRQPTITRRIGMPTRTMPLMGNSVAFLEQLLRRAKTIGADSVTLPVMLVGAQPSSAIFTLVRHGPDSILLVGPDGESRNGVHLAVDSAGRILGGIIPLSGTQIRVRSEP